MEFGVFTDEGMVAGDFYSREAAETWMATNCEPDEARVEEVCHDHEGQPRFGCERCAEDDDISEDR